MHEIALFGATVHDFQSPSESRGERLACVCRSSQGRDARIENIFFQMQMRTNTSVFLNRTAEVVNDESMTGRVRMTAGSKVNTSAKSFGDSAMEILVQVAVQVAIAWLFRGLGGGDGGSCAA